MECQVNTLDELAIRHATDKSSLGHHYTRVYESYLATRREQVRSVLEIGVWRGCSLKMWADYFPNARIVGLDISAADLPADLGDRVEFHLTDGTKVPLQFEKTDFDLVVDDGSHQSRDMIHAFESWFPHVQPGGLYVVEDLHAVYWPDYNVGCDPAAAIQYFKALIDELNCHGRSPCGNQDRDTGHVPHGRETDVAFIHFHKCLIVVGKR